MDKYNPHAPYILGHEWVPIRQNNITPTLDTEEYGSSFGLTDSYQIRNAAYYIATAPPHTVDDNVHVIAIYEKGTEHLSGAIRKITFPAAAIQVTGAAVTGTVAAILNPSDNSALVTTANAATCIGVTFDVDTDEAREALRDKRILGMNVVYTAAGTPTNLSRCSIWIGRRSPSKPNQPSTGIKISAGWEGADTIEAVRNLGVAQIGPVSPFTSSAIGNGTGVTEVTFAVPWTYSITDQGIQCLGRLPYVTDSLQIAFSVDHTVAAKVDAQMRLGYVALEIIYCDERRLKYGCDRITETNANPYGTGQRQVHGTSPIISSEIGPGGRGSTNALPAGNYTVTHSLSSCSPGVFNTKGYPEMNALRQLYELPTVPGVLVRNSGKLGATFTREATDIIQVITLHGDALTTTVTGTHGYVNQVAAPIRGVAGVGGAVTLQEIDQSMLLTPVTYQQVRFYARRGQIDPTTPTPNLTLTGLSPPVTGSAVSITAAAFDALPEILDGWKEVNLRFAVPPTFPGGSTDYEWQWALSSDSDAYYESAMRWQVLGANHEFPVTGSFSINPATYGDGTANLTWYDETRDAGFGSNINDFTADATLIFSVDPPVVTGFGITTGSMALTGIGVECSPDACIPTGIYCNNLAWQAIPTSSLPTTGFGAYQVERFDSYDNEWQLVMETGSMAVTGFCDYEARVGVPSLYRIRVTNALDFAGAWVTGSATIPAPGIIVSGTGNSTLIFTTNAEPTHSLAYTMNWDNRPEEFFNFPESDMVQLQQMYGKNFVTAFRPTERGGERFSRMLLVQDAAIPLPSLADFRGLRDLAWDQVPYVCVRDELGNRWYATVLVPSGSVTRNRRLYYAQVDIIEVTDTACAVDPAG